MSEQASEDGEDTSEEEDTDEEVESMEPKNPRGHHEAPNRRGSGVETQEKRRVGHLGRLCAV